MSSNKPKIVVDSIHGDIRPSELEWKIIDTPAFQRLRKLKQLQMGHLVYPNATHTRFAHSLGVLNVMSRILERVNAKPRDKEGLRLAALLHDVGHYPYSHLLEGIDSVLVTEEVLDPSSRSPLDEWAPYPDHERVGQTIVEHQPELRYHLKPRRAQRIGNLFARTEVTDQQLSKLIHSSLNMDRLDYLIRDSQGTGVPYGLVDIHYLLNHVRQSESGTLGIDHKALAAAEHLLLARSFLFRVVYQHKTIYGFEEAARQLLRRLRNRAREDGEGYGIPIDGDRILNIARGRELDTFTDAFLDNIFLRAASSEETDPIISILANTIVHRRPPHLLWEKRTFRPRGEDTGDARDLQLTCRLQLRSLAEEHNLHLGQFLICFLKPIGFESRGSKMSKEEAERMSEIGERTEMIRVFESPEATEARDIVDLDHSILHEIGNFAFRTHRLYFVLHFLKKAARCWWLGFLVEEKRFSWHDCVCTTRHSCQGEHP